jgi:hypothetical protein
VLAFPVALTLLPALPLPHLALAPLAALAGRLASLYRRGMLPAWVALDLGAWLALTLAQAALLALAWVSPAPAVDAVGPYLGDQQPGALRLE